MRVGKKWQPQSVAKTGSDSGRRWARLENFQLLAILPPIEPANKTRLHEVTVWSGSVFSCSEAWASLFLQLLSQQTFIIYIKSTFGAANQGRFLLCCQGRKPQMDTAKFKPTDMEGWNLVGRHRKHVWMSARPKLVSMRPLSSLELRRQMLIWAQGVVLEPLLGA